MNSVDGSEVLLLLIIGLIVLGPKRLPEIANKVGSWVGQARRMTRAMRRQLEDELRFDQKPDIHTPAIPPSVISESPEPAEPAEEPEAKIPDGDDEEEKSA